MRENIRERIMELQDVLNQCVMSMDFLREVENVANVITERLKAGNKILIFGNGGSAADAQHFAAELLGGFTIHKRPAIAAIALTTDTSTLTSIMNDYGSPVVFERQVQALVKPGDVVIGISTSGKSLNVSFGLMKANMEGAITIGLTGSAVGLIDQDCQFILKVPSTDTPRIQEVHGLIIHIICEIIEQNLFGDTKNV